eukprot:TCONS_00011547-protein
MEVKEELASIKMELKCWESMFYRKYQRKPTKEDINQSTPEIQDSYKRYAKLRNKSSDKTPVKPVEPEADDGVFGASLNKKHSTPKNEPKQNFIKHDNTVSWRPKLKALKRPTPNRDKDKSADEQVIEPSQVELSKQDDIVEVPAILDHVAQDNVKSTTPLPSMSRKSLGSVKRNRCSLLPTNNNDDSMEWLESCKQSLEKKTEKEVTSKSDDKTNTVTSLEQKSHKPDHQDAVDKVSHDPIEKENSKPVNQRTISMEELVNGKHLDEAKEQGGDSAADNKKRTSAKSERTNNISKDDKDVFDFEKEDESKRTVKQNDTAEKIKPKDTRKRTKKVKENADNENATLAVEGETKENTSKKKVGGKRKRAAEEENGDETVEKETKKVKVSKKAAPAKGKKLVSENFVKIDLRKKTYVRGIKKISASTQKRRAWKAKTSFEQPSKFGKKICFKCGGEGHWAKFCRGRPKQVDLFKRLDEEKLSLEYRSLAEQNGSCFDQLYGNADENAPSLLENAKKFTIDDVLDIKPCWPRTPYITDCQPKPVEPLIQPECDQPSQNAYKEAKKALKNFGFNSFREGQHEATARILSGLSTLVILATGSGKSLCYQLPAYMYYNERKWLTLVVSPLVALMQDQVAGLPDCLPGAALNSNMTKLQQQKVVTKLKEGKIAILLVSPEALVSGGFGTGILPPKSSLPPIGFACIDEAHCLSEWSHNFRPSYLKVCKVLRERYQIGCLLGLTATASNKTAKSVIQHLGVPDEGSIIRDPSPIPDNLQLTASRDERRDIALVELLHNEPFVKCDSIIVYVTRRMDCDRLAVLLRTSLPEFVRDEKSEGEEEERNKVKKKKVIKTRTRKKDMDKPTWWNCEAYHAGLSPAQRKRVQNQFMAGDLRIVVATVAFGMGLDKSDVRSVIHYNMPKSFENYVQEIGRAGRDGKPSFCHVFLEDEVTDLCELKRHIYGDTVDRSAITRFVDLLFPVCDCQEKYEKQSGEVQVRNSLEDDEFFRQKLDESDLELLFAEDFLPDEDDVCDSKDQQVVGTSNEESAVVSGKVDSDSECSNDGEHGRDESMDDFHDEEKEYVPNVDGKAFRDIDPLYCSNSPTPTTSSDEPNTDSKASEDIDFTEETIRKSGSDLDMEMEPKEGVFDESTPEDEDLRTECVCSGHRRSISSDRLINDLDMREEVISTFLAYLELHPKTWLRMLNPLRATCIIKCYGGPEQFQMMAKKFPPVALALRYLLPQDELTNLHERRQLEFDFVEVADLMCWDVLTVLRELKALQWNMSFALDSRLNTTGKSGIIVQTENLSFHFTTASNVDDDGRDEIIGFIHQTVLNQEETRLLQLDALYCVLKELSCKTYEQIPADRRIDVKARQQIGQFFLCKEEQQKPFLRELITDDLKIDTPQRRWNNIASDIRSLVNSYPDSQFNGRAIARIFQGIDSPRFPALGYGRDRRFWRQYLDVDFNELRKFAIRELMRT